MKPMKLGVTLGLALSLAACGGSGKSNDVSQRAQELANGTKIDFVNMPEGEYSLEMLSLRGTTMSEYTFSTLISLDSEFEIESNECVPSEAVEEVVGTTYSYMGVQSGSAQVPLIFENRNTKVKPLSISNNSFQSITYASDSSKCTTTIDTYTSGTLELLRVFDLDSGLVQKNGMDYTLSVSNLKIDAHALEFTDGRFGLRFNAVQNGISLQAILVYSRSALGPETEDETANAEPETYDWYYAPQPAVPPTPEKQVDLTEEEEEVVNQSSGGAVTRDRNGNIQSLETKEDAVRYAGQNGFSQSAAEDAFDMGKETNSLSTFAQNADQIEQATLDLMAHMKNRINSNSGDLELVFVIDISGSMLNDIEGVINGLDAIVASLERVSIVGRRVKAGIVTFGNPGQEEVQLQPTAELSDVRAKLHYIYESFNRLGHGIEPGEACYSGINCAATEIQWSFTNRMALVVTDEPSWEARTGRTDLIDEALRNIKKNAVESGIYTIVTK